MGGFNPNWKDLLINREVHILKNSTLSTSNRIFPYYQGESTIFDERNFLYQTPDTKNL